jgi:hypothetical protein
LSKTCLAENEEFCANKAKDGKRGIPAARPDFGEFQDLDFTGVILALAIQKEQCP